MPEKTPQIRINKESEFGKVFFEWKIPEFTKHQRSRRWYMVMILLAGILIIYSIFTANFLFALIIILGVFIIFLRDYSESKDLNFQITEDGLVIGNQFYYYKILSAFYIIYDPPVVKKLFFTLKSVAPDFSIPLNDMNPLLIRKRLLEYLDEDLDKENQTLDDQLESILKL